MSELDECNYTELAKAVFEIYTNISYIESNEKHKITLEEMIKFHKNRDTNLSLSSISLSGITENYNDFYPHYIRLMLDSFAEPKSKVRVV